MASSIGAQSTQQAQQQQSSQDEHVQKWKVKQLIRKLSAARGSGTSMISLIIPPKDQISRVRQLLTEELGAASNIKSAATRNSVVAAITSTQQKLKSYSKVPPTGLVVFCGMVMTDDDKLKKVNVDFEPYKPINTSMYLCDNKFHTEALSELLHDDETYGFIVIDGNGCLFGKLCGSNKTVLHKFSVDLPKKHGRGGQSALRFQRLRLEKRLNYIRKVASLATQLFIDQATNLPNIAGIVCAGSADFKSKLQDDINFDARLKKAVITTVDVSYGGESGFSQAIEQASETLLNAKYLKEKALVGHFFELVAKATNTFCYGVGQTMDALLAGAVKTLIVFEDLNVDRLEMLNAATNETSVHYTSVSHTNQPAQHEPAPAQHQPAQQEEMKLVSQQSLVEWFAENYNEHGAALELITDKSQEGSQFVKGFGGVGAILHYTFAAYSDTSDTKHTDELDEASQDFDLDDFEFDGYDAKNYENDFI